MVPILRDRIQRAIFTYCMPESVGDAVLDVGCGQQPFRPLLQELGYRYTGIDATQNADHTVDVVAATDEPFPPELLGRSPFGLILCTEVLEHVARWETTFENFRTCLRSGGKVLITCPHFYPLHEEPFDFWRPTLNAIEFFGQSAGFKLVSREPAGDAWDVLGTLLGSTMPMPVRPRFADTILSKVTWLACRCLLLVLHSNVLRQRVTLRGSVYLSNVVVFEAP